jgi:hypothetical protein
MSIRYETGKNTVPSEKRAIECIPFIRLVRMAMALRIIKIPARTAGGTGDLNMKGLSMTNKPTPTWTNWRVFSPEMFNCLRKTSLKNIKPRIIPRNIPKVIHSELKGWYIGTITPRLFEDYFRDFTDIFQVIKPKIQL